MIPRHPKGISSAILKRRMSDAGFQITLRSIQRDLVNLSAVIPLVNNEKRPNAWSWHADAAAFNLPALDPQTALTFKVAEAHLRYLLPASTFEFLEPWFTAAAGVLEACEGGLATWPEKIRVIPLGPRLEAPPINREVHASIYEALFQERMVEVSYLPLGSIATKTYAVHPIAVVIQEQRGTLVCTIKNYTNVRHLLLHRVQSARHLNIPAKRPTDFDLDRHIESGEFNVPLDTEIIAFEADFYGSAARNVTECPLSAGQTIEEIDDGWIRVRASVSNSLALRGWVRGFGDNVVVINPPELRAEFAEIAHRLCAFYDERP